MTNGIYYSICSTWRLVYCNVWIKIFFCKVFFNLIFMNIKKMKKDNIMMFFFINNAYIDPRKKKEILTTDSLEVYTPFKFPKCIFFSFSFLCYTEYILVRIIMMIYTTVAIPCLWYNWHSWVCVLCVEKKLFFSSIVYSLSISITKQYWARNRF